MLIWLVIWHKTVLVGQNTPSTCVTSDNYWWIWWVICQINCHKIVNPYPVYSNGCFSAQANPKYIQLHDKQQVLTREWQESVIASHLCLKNDRNNESVVKIVAICSLLIDLTMNELFQLYNLQSQLRLRGLLKYILTTFCLLNPISTFS